MPQTDQSFKDYVQMLAKAHGPDELTKAAASSAAGLERPSGFESMGAGQPSLTEALERVAQGEDVSLMTRAGLEAIIDADLRPVIDVVDGKFKSNHPLWTELSTNADIRTRLERCMPSIGRIELPGSRIPYGGTGFVVGKNLVMTNRHVAEIFSAGLGTRVQFKMGAGAGVDFVREQGARASTVFPALRVVMIHPYWDMAILEVEGLDARANLPLSLDDARDFVGRKIAVVGYPAFDPRNPADVQQNLFRGLYGVKRLQPGALQGGWSTASFGKMVKAAAHDCSTLGGNSGSAVIDLATGEIVALHFGGAYHERNYGVPTSELARDQRVIDAGVQFSKPPKADATNWAEWWQRADAEEAVDDRDEDGARMVPRSDRSSSVGGGGRSTVRVADDGSGQTLDVEIPIRIRITVGNSRVLSASVGTETVTGGDMLEAMKEPEHDVDYASRKGYQSNFLNTPGLSKLSVPMPAAEDPTVLASTIAGDKTLHYQNFSIQMHAKRRLALFTASNVTGEQKLRRPDPTKKYTRAALTGLAKGDVERWFLDARLDAKYQLPDVFFTKDRKAFDKGHIVRRDDIAWGTTYEEVKRANGDSYHVTNCSPQVKGFNQSSQGEDNWGDLENHVLSEAASERLCVFAGPVLKTKDTVFHGVGDGGSKLRAPIPARFWKVIVARGETGLAAYGFVLEQDLDDVQFEEFIVPENFAPAMYPLSDIEKMTGVRFDPTILKADQYDSVGGKETVFRAGIKRKRES